MLATHANEDPVEVIAAPSTNGVPSAGPPPAVLHLSDASDLQGVNSDQARSAEWSAFRPRSALVTPFSLRSARSSTPGTLEVNEATAISIYPHTNKSILVIQDSPHRPNSPLQNPRDPPKPPDLKLIPPTPANAPITPETEVQPSQPNTKNRLSGTISVMKRALSTHRHSDASVPVRSPSLARNNTVPNRSRPRAASAQEHNLHPFWRPRGFWDGVSDDSDSDSEFGNSGVLVGNSSHPSPKPHLQQPHSSGTSPSAPLSRSASLSRRLTGSLGLSKSAKHPTRSWTEHWSSQPSRDPSPPNHTSRKGLSQSERGQAARTSPSHEPRMQFVGFRPLAQWMEKTMNQREEGKREKVRERLRGSIDVIRGNAMAVQNSF